MQWLKWHISGCIQFRRCQTNVSRQKSLYVIDADVTVLAITSRALSGDGPHSSVVTASVCCTSASSSLAVDFFKANVALTQLYVPSSLVQRSRSVHTQDGTTQPSVYVRQDSNMKTYETSKLKQPLITHVTARCRRPAFANAQIILHRTRDHECQQSRGAMPPSLGVGICKQRHTSVCSCRLNTSWY